MKKLLTILLFILVPISAFADTESQMLNYLVQIGVKPEVANYLSDQITGGAVNNQTIKMGASSVDSDISAISGTNPGLLIAKDNSADSDNGDLIAFGGNSVGANLKFFKTRATSTTDANTIVQSGDGIGAITFYGADGTTYRRAAVIQAAVDTTPGASDMPGGLTFQLTPDGSTTPANVLYLSNDKSSTFYGAIKSTATNLGWAVRSAANTACNTTCTASHGCAFGYDTGTTALVDCSSALADSCVCSF